MGSIFIEITNENQLSVQEYVRLAGIKEQVEKLMESTKINEALGEYEKNLRGLSIDLTIKYTIEKRS
jgi:C1A family cysteine protease